MPKVYPDHTLENALRAQGVPVLVLWEMKGPPNTSIAWMVGYSVNGLAVIVQTFKGGNGWDAYTPSQRLDTEATIRDVIERTKRDHIAA